MWEKQINQISVFVCFIFILIQQKKSSRKFNWFIYITKVTFNFMTKKPIQYLTIYYYFTKRTVTWMICESLWLLPNCCVRSRFKKCKFWRRKKKKKMWKITRWPQKTEVRFNHMTTCQKAEQVTKRSKQKKPKNNNFFFSQKYLIPLKCWNVTFSVWFFFCVYLNKNIFTIYPITSCRKMFINKTQKIMICFFLHWYHGRRKKKSLTDLINNYNVIKLPF